MKVSFDLSVEDLVHFNQFHWRQSRAMKQMYRWSFAGAPVVAMAIALVLRSKGLFVASAAAAGAVCGYTLFLVLYTRWSLKWAVRKMLAEGDNRGVLGRHEIEIAPDGVHERTAVNRSHQSWTGIERIAEDDRYIYIYVQSMMAHVIPKAAFPSTADAAAFLLEARRRHASQRAGAESV
jgi:YcxB-like protein